MKTKPSNRIIYHCLIIIAILTIVFFFVENYSVKYIAIGVIFINLFKNKVTYLKLNRDHIVISRAIFLIIPTFKYQINLTDIHNFYLINYKEVLKYESLKFKEFEGSMITELLTGDIFYKPKAILVLELKQNKNVQVEINSSSKSLNKIISLLYKKIIIK